jgi:hypothetical protein
MRRNTRASHLFYQGLFWLGREDSNLRMVESKSAAVGLVAGVGFQPRLETAHQKPLSCSAFREQPRRRCRLTVDHRCGPFKPRRDQTPSGGLGPAREIHLTDAGR